MNNVNYKALSNYKVFLEKFTQKPSFSIDFEIKPTIEEIKEALKLTPLYYNKLYLYLLFKNYLIFEKNIEQDLHKELSAYLGRKTEAKISNIVECKWFDDLSDLTIEGTNDKKMVLEEESENLEIETDEYSNAKSEEIKNTDAFNFALKSFEEKSKINKDDNLNLSGSLKFTKKGIHNRSIQNDMEKGKREAKQKDNDSKITVLKRDISSECNNLSNIINLVKILDSLPEKYVIDFEKTFYSFYLKEIVLNNFSAFYISHYIDSYHDFSNLKSLALVLIRKLSEFTISDLFEIESSEEFNDSFDLIIVGLYFLKEIIIDEYRQSLNSLNKEIENYVQETNNNVKMEKMLLTSTGSIYSVANLSLNDDIESDKSQKEIIKGKITKEIKNYKLLTENQTMTTIQKNYEKNTGNKKTDQAKKIEENLVLKDFTEKINSVNKIINAIKGLHIEMLENEKYVNLILQNYTHFNEFFITSYESLRVNISFSDDLIKILKYSLSILIFTRNNERSIIEAVFKTIDFLIEEEKMNELQKLILENIILLNDINLCEWFLQIALTSFSVMHLSKKIRLDFLESLHQILIIDNNIKIKIIRRIYTTLCQDLLDIEEYDEDTKMDSPNKREEIIESLQYKKKAILVRNFNSQLSLFLEFIVTFADSAYFMEFNNIFLKFTDQPGTIDLYADFLTCNTFELSILRFFESKISPTMIKFYKTFFKRVQENYNKYLEKVKIKTGDVDLLKGNFDMVLERHIIDFLKFFVEKKETSLVPILNVIPFLPSKKEYFHIYFNIWEFVLKNNLQGSLLFFPLRTPALIDYIQNITETMFVNLPLIKNLHESMLIQYEKNKAKIEIIKNKLHYLKKDEMKEYLIKEYEFYIENYYVYANLISLKNLRKLFKHIFLLSIYYSEFLKLRNYNYTGIIEYIQDHSILKHFYSEFRSILIILHYNLNLSSSFIIDYVKKLLRLYSKTTESSKLLIYDILTILNKYQFIYNIKFHFIINECFKTHTTKLQTKKEVEVQESLIAWYKKDILLIIALTCPYLYDFIIFCICECPYFSEKQFNSNLNTIIKKTKVTFKKIMLFGTKYYLKMDYNEKILFFTGVKELNNNGENKFENKIKMIKEFSKLNDSHNKLFFSSTKSSNDSIDSLVNTHYGMNLWLLEGFRISMNNLKITQDFVENSYDYAIEILDKFCDEDSLFWLIDTMYIKKQEPLIKQYILEFMKLKLARNFKFSDLYILVKIYNYLELKDHDLENFLKLGIFQNIDFKVDCEIYRKLSIETKGFYRYYFFECYNVTCRTQTLEQNKKEVPYNFYNFDFYYLPKTMTDSEIISIYNIIHSKDLYEILRNKEIVSFFDYFINIDRFDIIDIIIILRHSEDKLLIIKALKNLKKRKVLFYVPQLVQCLKKKELYTDIFLVLSELCKNHTVYHYLIWNLRSNIGKEESKTNLIFKKFLVDLESRFMYKKKDKDEESTVSNLLGSAVSQFTTNKTQLDFLNELTYISSKMMPWVREDKEIKKVKLNEFILQIEVPPNVYLPTEPELEILAIVPNSAKALQSAAKVPFMVSFYCIEKSLLNKKTQYIVKEMINDYTKTNEDFISSAPISAHDMKEKQIEVISSDKNVCVIKAIKDKNGRYDREDLINFINSDEKITDFKDIIIKHLIFKAGDDCRQDMFALQLIRTFKTIFEKHNLDLFLYPYQVIATNYQTGIIEVVPNAFTRDQIGREKINNLVDYFEFKFGFKECDRYKKAVYNFTKSLAGYSLVTYFLNIKDRHNGNIMIDDDGHIIHIDFGYIFEISPGNLNLEMPLKLTKEIHDLLMHNEYYDLYVDLMTKGFFALRRNSKEIIYITESMSDSGLPCFKKGLVLNLIKRFKFGLSDDEVKVFVKGLIQGSIKKFRTWMYDQYQAYTEDIAF